MWGSLLVAVLVQPASMLGPLAGSGALLARARRSRSPADGARCSSAGSSWRLRISFRPNPQCWIDLAAFEHEGTLQEG